MKIMEGIEHVQTSYRDLNVAVKAIYQSNCWVGFACDEVKEKQIPSRCPQACDHSKNKDSVLLISAGKYTIHSVMHVFWDLSRFFSFG